MTPRLLRRAALVLGLVAAAAGAEAECTGPSLLDRLDAARRAAFDAEAEAVPHGRGTLWRASRGPARIFLAGTLHLPDARFSGTLSTLAPVILGADMVLVEATAAEESAMAQAVATAPDLALLPPGLTLADRLDPDSWALVAEAAQARGLAPADAARLRPWLLMMALQAPPCAARLMGPGLDRLVMEAAAEAGVPMAALEPWDTLFRLFASEDEERQLDMLRLSILDPASAEGLLVATRESYFAGRTAEAWELTRLATGFRAKGARPAEPAALDSLRGVLLSRRNAAWVPVIEAAAARSPRLVVAAGAAHLPGEDGVLRLLERSGWSVEPLDPATCCRSFWDGLPAG